MKQHPVQKSEEDQINEKKLMKQLASPEGFFQYFFNLLPKYDTRKEAFDVANDLYYELFDEYRYSSYNSFASERNQKRKRDRKK